MLSNLNNLSQNQPNTCFLCPNNCGKDRNSAKGFCGVLNNVKIAKYGLHYGEEPPISGEKGSGAIFFTGCSLKCVFCQNFDLSRNLRGKEISVKELADIFKSLEDMGAENINLVNPTHFAHKIIEAFDIYRPKIPVVYNTHGYEKVEILKVMNDYVDVYLPDIKYFSSEVSQRYCGKSDYFSVAKTAIAFMADSKPYLTDDRGMLKSGVIVRHLVLPQNVSDSIKILEWFQGIKDKACLNLMSQYTPFGKIENFPELQRKLTKREYSKVLDAAISFGIENMFFQDRISASEEYIPEWDF